MSFHGWFTLAVVDGSVLADQKVAALRHLSGLFLAGAMTGLAHSIGPFGVVCIVFLVTSLLTEFITNVAAATVTFPLALAIGAPLGISSHALAVAVAIGASTAFASPIGYQTNAIVAGAAGYRLRDFLRVGVPLKIVTSLVAIGCLAAFWRS